MEQEESSTDQSSRKRCRPCMECGTVLDVTYLMNRRKYACARCGMPFIHHPQMGLPPDQVKAREPRGTWGPLLLLGVFGLGLPLLVLWVFSLEIELERLLGILGGALVLTVAGGLWVRSVSRDPAGASAIMLAVAGFACVALVMLCNPPELDAQGVHPQTRMTFVVIALLGISGFSFSKFIRNRNTLMRVAESGKVDVEVTSIDH